MERVTSEGLHGKRMQNLYQKQVENQALQRTELATYFNKEKNINSESK